jgi:membrane protein implicated in regulation of membrane protease activity
VADHQMIGKMGRVTGTIAPGRLGEVMVQVRGGSEAFHAYSADNDETIPTGSRIVVVEYFPPRTVIVTPM